MVPRGELSQQPGSVRQRCRDSPRPPRGAAGRPLDRHPQATGGGPRDHRQGHPSARPRKLEVNCSDDALKKLLGPALSELETLDLRGHQGNAGAQAIAACKHLGKLRSLSFNQSEVGDAGAIALAGGKGLGALESLDLSSSQVGAKGATALVESKALGALRSLDLRGCDKLGDGAIKKLRKAAAARKDLAALLEYGDG